MSTKVFISYSHSDEDKEWVTQFANALKNLGVEVWLDDWAVPTGDSLLDALEKGLRDSDVVAVFVSPSSVGRPNLFFEMGAALGANKRLIPIVARSVPAGAIPYDIRARKYLTQETPTETARKVADALGQGS